MAQGTRVPLPPGVRPPFEVFRNGVQQQLGPDYEIRESVLVFARPLAKEKRLGLWQWFMGAFGIGTYGANDTIDIRYERDGRPMVAHDVPFEPAGAQPD